MGKEKKKKEKKREKSETISPTTVEYLIYTADFLVECCFTSTETVGLLGTGAQDVHLDFHTFPELCGFLSQMEYLIFTGLPSQWSILFTRVFRLSGVSYLREFSISMSILFTRVFRLNDYLIYTSFRSQ